MRVFYIILYTERDARKPGNCIGLFHSFVRRDCFTENDFGNQNMRKEIKLIKNILLYKIIRSFERFVRRIYSRCWVFDAEAFFVRCRFT